MSGAWGKIRYVAKAEGTWPYYFRADNQEEAEKWAEENLQSYDRKTGKPIYDWTITENTGLYP